MSIENILDSVLEDLADRPSITLFPNGAHKVIVAVEQDAAKQTVQLSLTYVEAIELADPQAVAPLPGDKNSVFFFLKNKKDGKVNEYAVGAIKEICASLKEGGVEGSKASDFLTELNGMEVVIVTKIRVGKGEYEGRDNLDIVKLAVV